MKVAVYLLSTLLVVMLEACRTDPQPTNLESSAKEAEADSEAQLKLPQDWAQLAKFAGMNDSLRASPSGERAPRVVLMGNSITEGWDYHYPQLFTDNPSWVNRGISGQTTPQMLVRFRPDVIELQPAVVVILAGINDIAGNTGPMTLEQTFGNLISMSELARANGIRVVLASVLPAYDFPWRPGLAPAQKVVSLNRMVKQYAAEQGHVFLDFFTPMADDRPGLRTGLHEDEVHPNAAGYAIMAPLVEDAVAKALARAR